MIKFSELNDMQKAAAVAFFKQADALGQISSAGKGLWKGTSENLAPIGRQFSTGFKDLRSGLSKDISDISQNVEKNWARRAKESQYGNFANIGPLLPVALGGTLMAGMGVKSLLGKILRRGK